MGLNSKVIHKQSLRGGLGKVSGVDYPQIEAKSTGCTSSNDSKVYGIDCNYIGKHFSIKKTEPQIDTGAKEQERPSCEKSIKGVTNKQVGIQQ